MTDRRTAILDAALDVLAAEGLRGLTHRAVDAGAALPEGSTSYYFRTRAALVDGCVHRLVEIDLRESTAIAPDLSVPDLDAFLDLLAGVVAAMAGPQRSRSLARFQLSIAAMHDAEVRATLALGGASIQRMTMTVLAILGARDPEVAASEVLRVVDGVLFEALVLGDHDTGRIGVSVRSIAEKVLRAQPGLGGR